MQILTKGNKIEFGQINKTEGFQTNFNNINDIFGIFQIFFGEDIFT